MNNAPPVGPQMMWPPFWPPPFWQQPQPQQQAEQLIMDPIVPARVYKAMEFVNMMTAKTMQKVAATDTEIRELNGQELTTDERTTVATACHLLSQYFCGKLPTDNWDDLRIQLSLHGRRQIYGPVIDCVNCKGTPNPNCHLCRGSGQLVTLPGPDKAPAPEASQSEAKQD